MLLCKSKRGFLCSGCFAAATAALSVSVCKPWWAAEAVCPELRGNHRLCRQHQRKWDSQPTQGNSSIHISEPCWKLVNTKSEHSPLSSCCWCKSMTSSAWLAPDHCMRSIQDAGQRKQLVRLHCESSHHWTWPWLVCTYLFIYSREGAISSYSSRLRTGQFGSALSSSSLSWDRLQCFCDTVPNTSSCCCMVHISWSVSKTRGQLSSYSLVFCVLGFPFPVIQARGWHAVCTTPHLSPS